MPSFPVAALLLAQLIGCSWSKTDQPIEGRPPVARDGMMRLDLGKDAHGEARTAVVHVPASYDPSKKWPAIWVFHGGKNKNADQQVPNWRSHFDDDYILVFPNGQRSDPGMAAWFVDEGDDMLHVDVVRRLHQRLESEYNIGKHYATGFSSGAHMTWQLACTAPELFHGFAPVAHYLLTRYADNCSPSTVRPLLLVGSRDDPSAPYDGAYHGEPRMNFGAGGSLRIWAERAGCPEAPDAESPVSRGAGKHMKWTSCAKAPMEHVQLKKVGHEWPGGKNSSGTIDATEVILDFWERTAGL
jgi:polyhydroxybutyrate depolymerase